MTPEQLREWADELDSPCERNPSGKPTRQEILRAHAAALEEVERLKGHAEAAVPIVEHFCSRNPCWTNGIGPTQDPLGAHAWLAAYRAEFKGE